MKIETILWLLLCLVVSAAIYLYDLNSRYLACKQANRGLAELLLDDERPLVELRQDVTNGDVYIRVNGQHYYQFEAVCGRRT